MSTLEGGSHSSETTVCGEVRVVTEDRLLLGAVIVGDGVVITDSGPGVLGLEDDNVVLNPDTTDLDELTSGGHVVGDELGDDGDLLGGIDSL